MKKLKLAILALCALLMVIVIFQNSGETEARILFYSVRWPLAFLLFLNAIGGFVLGVLACYILIRGKAAPRT